MGLENLWEMYLAEKCIELRNEIVERNLNLVKYIAARLVKTTTLNGVEYDDLVSFGVMGLMQAVERFNPKVKCKFATFASIRIQGSILDEMRKIDWVPRSSRSKIKKARFHIEQLEQELGESVDHYICAREEGLSLSDFYVMTNQHIISIEELNYVDAGAC